MSPQKLFSAFLLLTILAIASPGVVHGQSSMQNANTIRCLGRERQALLDFKAELVDEFGRLSSWGNGEENNPDCCGWRGVHCHNETYHVVRLDLHSPQKLYLNYEPLKGTISTSLLELQHLQYLDLSANDFNTSIPEFIGSLSELKYLNLSYCDFTGPIPYHLGNLSKLLTLNLGYNSYESSLYSKSLGWVSELHSLELLDLSSVDISLANNWLVAISKLTNIKELSLGQSNPPNILPSLLPPINASNSLEYLSLQDNSELISTLSLISWFSNFSSSLAFVDLSYANMQGPIPDVFEKMVSLEHLNLQSTWLQGVIPKYFGNMSSLRHLDLGDNNLTQVPKCLQLPYLEVLDLSSNKIKGPTLNLSGCPSLEVLYLSHNMLNGTLNGHIGGLSKLEVLSIGSNLLVDTINESHILFNLSQLRHIDLSFNTQLTINCNPDWIPSFQLEYIGLARCNLGPNFPAWLQTQRKMMSIDISDVGITGTIPTWFGDVTTELLYLNACNNQIHGAIPKFSFPNKHFGSLSSTMVLDLSRNNISGPINFLCQSEDWWLIDLSENQFSGQIPQCFEKFERLEYLNLASNLFVGEIPNVFRGVLSLLNLRNNKLTGELPTSMRNCTELDIIDLGENSLKGDIPAWIGDNLLRLKVLVLRSNEFHGSIPTSLCNLEDVQVLDFSANNISGVIPKCVSKWRSMSGNTGADSRIYGNIGIDNGRVLVPLYTDSIENSYFMWKGKEVKYINHLGLVKLLDLSTNSLHGEIPSAITKLDGLIGLNLSRNNLIGSIPPNIGEMKSLDFLDLSRNHLSGIIPPSISGLSHLGLLDLSYNNLSGRIPQDNQALTFEESDFGGNPGLCGPPLNKSCPGDQKPENPSSSIDHDSDNTADSNDDELVMDGFYISMAIGFVCAFSGAFWTTVLNKSIGNALFSKVFKRFY